MINPHEPSRDVAQVAGSRRRARLLDWSVLPLLSPVTAFLQAEWAKENNPVRLLNWAPVLFGIGILLHLGADRDPSLWAAVGACMLGWWLVWRNRQRWGRFLVSVGLALIASGFLATGVRIELLRHPVVTVRTSTVEVTGLVLAREVREKSDRILIAVSSIERLKSPVPGRVRLVLRKGMAPPVGSVVRMRASLQPPPQPVRPGGYDLARDLWFQGIGAIGMSYGKPQIEAAQAQSPTTAALVVIEQARDALDARIRQLVPAIAGRSCRRW